MRRVCLYVDASAAAEKEVRRQENQTLWYVYTPFIHHYGGRDFSLAFWFSWNLISALDFVNLARRQRWRRPPVTHLAAAGIPFSAPGQLLVVNHLLVIGHMESLVWSSGKPCQHIMPPSDDVVLALSRWQPPVAAAEGWCGRSGAGVFVVRCLPRGDTGAWPTRIWGQPQPTRSKNRALLTLIATTVGKKVDITVSSARAMESRPRLCTM